MTPATILMDITIEEIGRWGFDAGIALAKFIYDSLLAVATWISEETGLFAGSPELLVGLFFILAAVWVVLR